MLKILGVVALLGFSLSVADTAAGQDSPQSQGSPEGRAQIVQVQRIFVKGTRLPSLSVIRIMGLKAGDQVDDAIVNAACHRLSSTGLVKSVDYQYAVFPDKPGVQLTLTVVDEAQLVPASIQPEQDQEAIWAALKQVDPLFGPELPPNVKALDFYSKNLTGCLKRMGRTDEYAAARLVGKPGEDPTAVVFEIKKYKGQSTAER
jgi:outer membrane protein assembly factor BamA